MSTIIARKYIGLMSPQLQRFQRKNADLWNFRCPICGDSEQNKSKARGYIYRKKDKYNYTCYNCGDGRSFARLLEFVDTNLYQQFCFEQFAEKRKPEETVPFYSNPKKLKNLCLENALPVSILPEGHVAVEYINSRRLPMLARQLFYYTPDFSNFVACTDTEHAKRYPHDARLLIPFVDDDGVLTAVQGRALDPEEKRRYITWRVHEDMASIFGLDRVNKTQMVYLFEGPFDSLFMPNAIAMAGLSNRPPSFLPKLTLVLDNQPRNKDVVKIMSRFVRNGQHVCVWPSWILGKDVNEMVLHGTPVEYIRDTIRQHSFKGLEAQMAIDSWKRCETENQGVKKFAKHDL